MIISASRRTDIPGYFPDWFIDRLEEGEVTVANPRFPKKHTRVDLHQSNIRCIVFWTKYPRRMIDLARRVTSLGYMFYVQCTVNPYGNDIEPGMGNMDIRLDDLRKLSEQLGPKRVIWRYDPVVITREYPVEFHLETFSKAAENIRGYIHQCVFSFVDIYTWMKGTYSPVNTQDMFILSESFSRSAKSCGFSLFTCSESADLQRCGISRGACIDAELIGQITGLPTAARKDPSQRKHCRCIKSVDIGTYGTCSSGCRYCYACPP